MLIHTSVGDGVGLLVGLGVGSLVGDGVGFCPISISTNSIISYYTTCTIATHTINC